MSLRATHTGRGRRPGRGRLVSALAAGVVLAGGALAACAQPTPAVSAPAASGVTAAMLDAIRADAAQRTGMAPQALELGTPLRVTWSDGSLGCPMPERMYTQALVPGWRIVVQAGSQHLDYHANLRGTWLYCPPDRARPPASASRM